MRADRGGLLLPRARQLRQEAKRICGMCPIRTACLEYALDNDERFGVWGGLSEKERLEIRRTGSR